MDFGCSCACSVFDEAADHYHAEMRKARKQHVCCECDETIEPGETYERVSSVYDGDWSHAKTCALCVKIRDEICCNGFVHGQLRVDIQDAYGFDYVTNITEEDLDKG